MATLTQSQTTFLSTANAAVAAFQTQLNNIVLPLEATFVSLTQKATYLQSTYSQNDVNCNLTNEINDVADLLFAVSGAMTYAVSATSTIVSIQAADPSLSTAGDAANIEKAGRVLEAVQAMLIAILQGKQLTVNSLNVKSANLQRFYSSADANCNLFAEAIAIASAANSVVSLVSAQTFVTTMVGVVETMTGTD